LKCNELFCTEFSNENYNANICNIEQLRSLYIFSNRFLALRGRISIEDGEYFMQFSNSALIWRIYPELIARFDKLYGVRLDEDILQSDDYENTINIYINFRKNAITIKDVFVLFCGRSSLDRIYKAADIFAKQTKLKLDPILKIAHGRKGLTHAEKRNIANTRIQNFIVDYLAFDDGDIRYTTKLEIVYWFLEFLQ
jgi:hypothetical protein